MQMVISYLEANHILNEEATPSHDTSFDDTSTQMTTLSNRQVRFKDGEETIGHSEPYEYDDDDNNYLPDQVSSFSTKEMKKQKKMKKKAEDSKGNRAPPTRQQSNNG